jgi:hypothetical protein
VSKDQAARIVLAAFTVREDGRSFYTRPQLEGRIRRAIASAVRKERERCVKCAEAEAVAAVNGRRFVSAYRIMGAIESKGNKRKGKR